MRRRTRFALAILGDVLMTASVAVIMTSPAMPHAKIVAAAGIVGAAVGLTLDGITAPGNNPPRTFRHRGRNIRRR